MFTPLSRLQQLFPGYKIAGYLIPTSDEFQSEYPADYAKRLEYITGFTGSNGLALVLTDKVLFFTDSRYLTQAELELDPQLYHIFNITDLANFYWGQYIESDLLIGYDPMLFTARTLEYFKNLNLLPINGNLVDKIWENKPPKPASKVWDYPLEFNSASRETKLKFLYESLAEENLKYYLLTSPESICWLLNIRAHDSEFCPIMLSYALISEKEIIIFTQSRDFSVTLPTNIKIEPLEALEAQLKTISDKIGIDPTYTSVGIMQLGANWQNLNDPCLIARAIKTEAEITGAEKAHIEDAVAVCEFLSWLDNLQNKSQLNEYDLGLKISEFRASQPNYLLDSFAPICGYGANGAIVHYRAKAESALNLTGSGLLLIDSGGHYLGGTTDITRTITIGAPTKEQQLYYTLVLKGHLALSSVKFPKGCTGAHLDILARQYLWLESKDYGHGTGHGVGNCLNVHEGPQRISLFDFKTKLEPGMIVSNEPGYYLPGQFGIRIENLQMVTKAEEGFLQFEPLTLVPYYKELILTEELTSLEKKTLAAYYQRIIQEIAPRLSNKAKGWVMRQIRDYL